MEPIKKVHSRRKDTIERIKRKLYTSEVLLRYLHYPPSDMRDNTPDPLSSSLPNIIASKDASDEEIIGMWDVIENHIVTTKRITDLEKRPICRIYLYLGRVNTIYGRNSRSLRQEVVIDILCHRDYEKDLRLEVIADHVNDMIYDRRDRNDIPVLDYSHGMDISAPNDYNGFRHIYTYPVTKR